MNKTDLTWFPDLRADSAAAAARIALLETVFNNRPCVQGLAPEWIASGFFYHKGDCIATLEVARLSLLLDGTPHIASGIRLVAVHPDWRGRGLSREMMMAALASCDAAAPGLVLLYAAVSDLYVRYGFRPMPQHAFVGAAPLGAAPVGEAPMADGTPSCRSLDQASDRALITRLLARRAPVSGRCAIVDAPGLFFDRLAGDPDIRIVHLHRLDAIVAYEIDDRMFVLVDVVAEDIPSLASILGAIGGTFETVKTLFPPDKLRWRGEPMADDTGLMVRGAIPATMTVPFMFPPTTEF